MVINIGIQVSNLIDKKKRNDSLQMGNKGVACSFSFRDLCGI